MPALLPHYEETLLGLPYPVALHDAAEMVTHPVTGAAIGIAVPDAEELAASVALALCFLPVRLSGAEVRFLRRVLGLSGQALAAAVEMDPATLSRWEHGKQEVGAWADKAVRMAAVLGLADRAPGSHLRADAIVALRVAPRPEGFRPGIDVRRVPLRLGRRRGAGWDACARAA